MFYTNIVFFFFESKIIIERSDSEEDDGFDGGFDGKNRSSRGLRVLSLKVKDIVSEKKRTSYKEVAECLIEELGQIMKGKLQGEVRNYMKELC